jgi:hypothetical protein
MGNVPLFQQFASIEECLSNIIVLVKLSNFRRIHDSRLDPSLAFCSTAGLFVDYVDHYPSNVCW